eukprot:COSAG01_NODE_25273_length_750_cov_1.066052_1_plen_37_part_10
MFKLQYFRTTEPEPLPPPAPDAFAYTGAPRSQTAICK